MKKRIFLLIFLLAGCTVSNESLKNRCCLQCTYCADHDARAIDINSRPCTDYQNTPIYNNEGHATNEKAVSPECLDFFMETSITVMECRS